MANTYTQIHIQIVCVVKNRASIIKSEWKEELYKYISGIVANRGHKLLAINGMPDHIHILIGFRPAESLSDLMREIKSESSKWINENKVKPGKFSWQQGYGAFSYSKSHVDRVINYIKNQEEHHRKKSFKEEYVEFLKKFEVEYDERFLFDEVKY